MEGCADYISYDLCWVWCQPALYSRLDQENEHIAFVNYVILGRTTRKLEEVEVKIEHDHGEVIQKRRKKS